VVFETQVRCVLSDYDKVFEVIHEMAEDEEIPDAVARVIASWWHGGQASLGYSFVSTGAVPDDTSELWRELFKEYRFMSLPDRRAADYMGTYLIRHAGRGPVAGWSGLWV
jgi:hypothetical protein